MPSGNSDQDVNPFATPPGERDPVRRLRGRLAAPVTIVTAGEEDDRTGLTIASIVVAEGEPGLVYFLLGSATDLFYAIERTGRFIVHVCSVEHRQMSDVFAGLRPSPGGMFAGSRVAQSDYGPELEDIGTRAYCSGARAREESYSTLISGSIDRVEPGPLDEPLAYFRGAYRTLE